ncbi:hypothetical protein [Streptosporangium sp. NPDC002607]
MAVTIPCTTGTVALYQETGGPIVAVPVEAWDLVGLPYIAGAKALVAAESRAGFLRLEHAAWSPSSQGAARAPIRTGPRPPAVEGRKEREGA